MSLLLFLIVLFALVLVHEWGHFIVAKKTGMRVDEFGIGFPPRLFSRRRGETLYSLNALPIGGYVKIYGENAADAAGDDAQGKDVSRSFTARPRWVQSLVLVAGVAMNVIFAWLLFSIAFMVGVPTAVDENMAGDEAVLMIQSVAPDTPAAAANLPQGAVIKEVSIGDTVVEASTPTAFREIAAANAGQPISVTYTVHDGPLETAKVTPETGHVADDPLRAVIGVQLALVEEVSEPIHLAVWYGAVETWQMLGAIIVGVSTLIAGAFQGTADLSSVTGPVGIVGMVGDAAAFGVTALLTFTAMISLNLAVINLLPFPALDGGRLLFVAAEAVMRRPINPVWVERLNALGFLLLMALMVAVTYRDIVRLF